MAGVADNKFTVGQDVRATRDEGAIFKGQVLTVTNIDDDEDMIKMEGYTFWYPARSFVPCISDSVDPATKKIASDGGSTGYYAVLDTDKDCQDIIERKDMNWNRANVFKAAFRMGEKDGPDELYDWRKIKWFAEREIARLEKTNEGL